MNTDILEELSPQYNYHRGLFISAHISDIHFPVMDPKVQYDILENQFIKVLEPLERLDAIFINGDLYDHKVLLSSDAAYYASLFIGRLVDLCRVKQSTLVILQGTLSHDANQLKLYYHYTYDSTVDVRIITKLQFELIKDCRVLCIPELYGVDESIYESYLKYGGYYDIAIMHGTFKGSVYGDNVGNGRLFTIDDFNNCRGFMVAGHIHKPDCFNNHFYYCGSPYAWTFDDDHDKGFIISALDLDSRKYYLERVPIISFIYRTFRISELSEDPKTIIDYIIKLKEENGIDYIRIFFDYSLSNTNKSIVNDYFRTNDNVTLRFMSTNEEIFYKQKEEMKSNIAGYEYIIDSKISDEEKFCMYINQLKGSKYITVDELIRILKEE